ncbi:MAG: hypothetical protein NT067_07550 [Candidatus Diapherotrites archaeon]|nr:hypothetical protein [Candidatus Diapherotrites archaeon]
MPKNPFSRNAKVARAFKRAKKIRMTVTGRAKGDNVYAPQTGNA